MNPCPNYISESILFRITRYGEQKYDCYMAEAADVNRIFDHGKIPLLQLPINADGPVVAILPAVEKHQDRLEPDYAIPEFYIKAIVQNGGCPVPVGFDKTIEQLEIIQPQAILLPGGDFRLPPEWILKEQPENGSLRREKAYEAMIDYAQNHHLPLLGICAGEQVLAGMFGAKLKPVANHRQAPDKHSHKINIRPHSLLAKISGMSCFETNSNHHLAAELTPECNCIATAQADDGTIEAIELKQPWHWFVLGVQWHPERFINRDDALTDRLFGGFIKAAKGGVALTWENISFAEANLTEISDQHFIIDMMYARKDNISGQPVYQNIGFGNKAYVRTELWQRLQKIIPWLEEHQLKLKICDAFRPLAAHRALKEAIGEQGPGLFASCGEISKHCHGTAVDVVLCHLDGTELKYPTPADCYSQEWAEKVQRHDLEEFYEYAKQGRHDYKNPQLKNEIANRKQLRELMESAGLSAINSEWWHYEMPDMYNLQFPVILWP